MSLQSRFDLLVWALLCWLILAACATETTPTAIRTPAALVQTATISVATVTTQPSSTQTAIAIPSPTASDKPGRKIYSPDRQYYMLFAPYGTGVFRSVDQQYIVQSEIVVDPTQSEVIWAPNSQLVAISDYQHTFLWFTDGRSPFEVPIDQAFWLTWSPDSTRLAAAEYVPSLDTTRLVVIQDNGAVQRVGDSDIQPGQTVNQLKWISRKVVEVWASSGACCGLYVYFNAETAESYPSWITNVDGDQLDASISPDGVWRVARSSYRLWRGEPFASTDYFEHEYTVLNFESGEIYDLYDGSDRDIDWVGWTPDSETFHFVNRPTGSTTVESADLPFGWLALNPVTHRIETVFAQAIFAQLNADQTQACVVFPAKDGAGTLGLDAGWYELATGTLTERQRIADQVPYSSTGNRNLLPPNFAAERCQLN